MNLDLYFPTPIWWEDIHIDNNAVLNFCHSLRDENPKGRKVSNVGGWQSDDIAPGEKEELSELISTIYEKVGFCLDTYGFKPGSVSMEIGNLWVNINGKNDVNMAHTHTTCFLSGVYYVKASKESSNIVFYRNFVEDFVITSIAPVERHTQLSGSTAQYPPRTGRLIMFPSWVGHSVLPNPVDEERISIAFNIKMKSC